jgi:hypothetical protein
MELHTRFGKPPFDRLRAGFDRLRMYSGRGFDKLRTRLRTRSGCRVPSQGNLKIPYQEQQQTSQGQYGNLAYLFN